MFECLNASSHVKCVVLKSPRAQLRAHFELPLNSLNSACAKEPKLGLDLRVVRAVGAGLPGLPGLPLSERRRRFRRPKAWQTQLATVLLDSLECNESNESNLPLEPELESHGSGLTCVRLPLRPRTSVEEFLRSEC